MVSSHTHSIIVSAIKPSIDSKVGVGLKNAKTTNGDTGAGGVYINSIREGEGSIFVNTELKVGMIIENINGINCTFLTSADAADILRQAENEISMVVLPAAQAIVLEEHSVAGINSTVDA